MKDGTAVNCWYPLEYAVQPAVYYHLRIERRRSLGLNQRVMSPLMFQHQKFFRP